VISRRRRYRRARRGHDAQRGGYQELRLDDASFDLIHVYDVIEHVPDPIDLLRCAARWVKPGGSC